MSTLQFQQVVVPAGTIDLGVGQPDASLLPLDLFADLARRAFSPGVDNGMLQYGAEWGDGHHRVALGAFLSEAYSFPVDPELLLSTNGNSQALDLICTVFMKRGDIVLVEEPTYFLGRSIFASHGVRCVGIPVDDNGLDVAAADAAMSDLRKAGEPLAALYCIPAFHNPTGVNLSSERRARLVESCREHDVLLIADEVYHLLTYRAERPMPLPLSSFADGGHVLSLGTFSKILAPGARLGWIHASETLLSRLAGAGIITSGGGLNPVVSALVTEALRHGGQATHLAWLRQRLGERSRAMGAALRRFAPEIAPSRDVSGGYFYWLTLPAGLDATDVRAACQQHGVDLRHGPLFSSAELQRDRVRLSFAFYEEAEITEGVRRFAGVLSAMMGR